jgi:hypothetical protein
MSTRKESGYVQVKKKQNIFDYISSRVDKKYLRYAMKNAPDSIPEIIEITFQVLDLETRCLCHVFRYENRYFIGGWRMNLYAQMYYFPLQERAAW